MAFFLSGAAGLVYQLIWIRQFGNIFGNNVNSASVVVAVFMCGLGVGAWLGGRWADRRLTGSGTTLLRSYAGCEVGVALLGLALSFLLPSLGEFSGFISSSIRDAGGWYRPSAAALTLRYLVAAALLAPSTLLMGATLTILIRYLVPRRLEHAGVRISALYGANTAGAAVGAFLTDYSLVPGLGLTSTLHVACALNLAAALLVVRFAARSRAVESPFPPLPPPTEQKTESLGPVGWASLFLFASGFAGMTMELVWFRHLICSLGTLRAVLSLLLTVILAGMWLGTWAGGLMVARVGKPVALLATAQALFMITTLGSIASNDGEATYQALLASAASYADLSPFAQSLADLIGNLKPILREAAVPAFFIGFSFPLANAVAQRVSTEVGSRAGVLYLTNTLGAVSGALLAGFLLLPRLGTQQTIGVVLVAVLVGLGALVPLARGEQADDARRLSLPVVAAAIGVLAVASVVWLGLPGRFLIERTALGNEPTDQLLSVTEGAHETIAVVERPGMGRYLMTNGHPMSGSSIMDQRYMRAFVHLPLLMAQRAQDVLVICFGVGNTVHAASLHPNVKRIDLVDLSEDILRQASWFSASNHGVLSNPKVHVHVDDGRQYLRSMPDASYDLITMEPPPLAQAGVAGLYSRDFYELAARRLKPGGSLTQWLPMGQISEQAIGAVIKAFMEVFPQTVLLSGNPSQLILMGIKGPAIELDPDRVLAGLANMPEVRADLEHVYLDTLPEIVGTFVASAPTLARATEGGEPVTDDRPNMEYSNGSLLRTQRLPEAIFNDEGLQSYCPKCFVGGQPRGELPNLVAHMQILARLYHSPDFRDGRGDNRSLVLPDTPEVNAAMASSRYLRALLGAHLTQTEPGGSRR